MANPHKIAVLAELQRRFGDVRKLKGSESLFVIGREAARVYFRYSKVHSRGRTFFGLRRADLRSLEGQNSYIVFLLGDGSPPLFITYADFENVFHRAEPASDGQYKVQLLTGPSALELYIARQGRFNVEGYVGMETLERSIDAQKLRQARLLGHFQVQTLVAAIGHAKGYDVWIPDNNLCKLDWTITKQFELRRSLPTGFESVSRILSEIDVVWIRSGSSYIEGLYEVEHSTPIYSGLLRFNDILLTNPKLSQFWIVSNDVRRELFAQQVFRPTFKKSGLAEVCSFLDYANVDSWHQRLIGGNNENL
ncbi:MAG: hypothetical protein WBD87_00130 [Candidatus Acidiferrales bacterium]